MKRLVICICVMIMTSLVVVGCSKKEESDTTKKSEEKVAEIKEPKEEATKEPKEETKTMQVLYGEDKKIFELSFDPTYIDINENCLETPQVDIYLNYNTEDSSKAYNLKIDSEAYDSLDAFYKQNVDDCKKIFKDCKATKMEEIKCNNISFYKFTCTYTDNTGKKTISPLYVAEIEKGTYCYIDLGDTMQFEKEDKELLKINEKMLKELFVDFKVKK